MSSSRKKYFLLFLGVVLGGMSGAVGRVWAQAVYLNQSSPASQVLGGQSVIYNLVYGNTAVPVTTMDTFEADTVGNMPLGWVTYGGTTGTVMSATVTSGINGPTAAGNQAVYAVFNYGCTPYCGRMDYTAPGPVTDGFIQADLYFPNTGNAVGLMWRNDVNDNQYQMTVVQGTNNNINLVAQDNSPYQILTTTSAVINTGQWYTVKLAVSGVGPVTLTGYVNGGLVSTASTTIALGPGYSGVQVQGNSMVIFDNVQIIQSPDANSVKLMDTLPTGLAYITSTGSPVLSGQLATWNLGNVVAGSSATIQLVTTANNCNTTFINSPLLTVGAPSSAVTAGPVTVQALCSPTPTPPAPGNKPYVYSNPSSGPTVQFVYNMADSGKADIRIWNASGVLAASLEDVKPSGIQQSTLNIQAFAPGHYFYQIDLKYDSGQEDRSPTQVLAVQK
jgi:hypothetical protein